MQVTHAWARRGAAIVVGAVVIVGVSGCGPDRAEPGPVVAALAAGMAAGDLTGVALTGATAAQATTELTAAIAGLDPLRPEVKVGTVTVAKDGKTATAALGLVWDFDASEQDWVYTTTAHLELADDRWSVRWSPFLIAPDLVAGETLSVRRTAMDRALVLGAGGAALVQPRAVLRLGIDKTKVDAAGQDAAARALAALLDLDPQAYAERVAAAGAKAFVEALVVRTENPGVDLSAVEQVPGLLEVADTIPLAPTRLFARAILGTAGPATAEIVAASKGQVVAGDTVGLSGLQRQYDAQLRGEPDLTIVATAADGAAHRDLFTRPGTPGLPLVTTLDPALQTAAEAVLDPVGPASAIVAIRPSTGEVLAAASGPGSAGLSTATLAKSAPGSVFKVVSSLALLRTGLTPDSPMTCPTSTVADGRTFENYSGYPSGANGTISLQTAVANSCNTAFVGARDLVTQADLVQAAASLGLGGTGSLGYPAFLGSVPNEASATGHAASMIGQAQIEASPLAMATVAASVARGQTVVPWLVGATAPAVAAPAKPLTEPEATALRTMMRAVVTDGGAGLLRDVPGPEVAAKTGTAEFGTAGDLKHHTWMIAIQGDLAVAVYVDEGDFGSTTAGPLLVDFLARAQG